jgi:LuxR family transcriptional regulator, maltose regulon positive regulatory protein
MPHSFRFDPPEPRSGSLTRPRLLRALLARWERRVVTVVGGPGLGKTTLLAQSVAENRLAPRGVDVWIGAEVADADGDGLARDVAAALAVAASDASGSGEGRDGGADPAVTPSARAVADAVWRRAPVEVCLFFDNVHQIPPGSAGATWLTELVEAMPVNGHVLMSSRARLPVPVARMVASGTLEQLDEGDLRFTDDELADFAARRGVPPQRLAGTGGWPAMAELAAAVDRDLGGEYLWEEVLTPLGASRRRALAVVCDLAGADDALASDALGAPIDLGVALAGIPMVAGGADGWREPHPLWQTVRALKLEADDRERIRRRAIDHLVSRQRYDDAMTLAQGAGLDDVVPQVLRAACVSGARPSAGQIERWLATSPQSVRSSPGGQLASALRASLVAPGEAISLLRDAATRLRQEGDVDGELVAIANVGRLTWWSQDRSQLVDVGHRVGELDAAGHPFAHSLAALGVGIFSDLAGDDAGALAAIDDVAPGTLDEAWQAMAGWLKATVLAGMGDAAAARAIVDGFPPVADPNFVLTLEGLRLTTRWMLGEVDEVVAGLSDLIGRVRAVNMTQNLAVLLSGSSRIHSQLGDVPRARQLLDEAATVLGPEAGDPIVRLAAAEASLQLAEGDDDGAAATLAKTLDLRGLGAGVDRRTWRLTLPLTYVLVPSSRDEWDAAPLRGFLATARELAAAVVAARALRSGSGAGPGSGSEASAAEVRLRTLDLPPTGVVRAALHHRLAAELAVGLESVDHPGAPALLEAVGSVGRAAVRDVAAGTGSSRRARSARALLAAVPAPPPAVTELALLGPLTVRRDGRDVDDPALRRERLRALLAYLVSHRDTTRAAIMAALWPDLDERAAANNLRVTFTYVHKLLEPWRSAGESAFYVRTAGPRVQLVTGEWLRIDVDAFDEHVAAASRAEADGTPSLALEHHLAAAALYRGELHADVPEAEWNALERDHYRSRFVAAACRAGQLLAARGDMDDAEAVARRAIAVDQWAEDAYAVLVSTALARGDRSAARHSLDRCLAALADLGVEPSEETQRLRRRLRGSR